MTQERREDDRVNTEAATRAAYEAGLAEGIIVMSSRREQANWQNTFNAN